MKTLVILLTEAITLNGSLVEAGEIIELSEKSALALIEEDKATEVIAGEETGKALEGAGSPGSDAKVDPNLSPSNGSENVTGEELDLIRKALDDKYKGAIPELKEHAKEVGVEFPYDANKGEIIALVIEAGKAEAVLAK